MDIQKGQKVWINADFCGLNETEVIVVGRKYITVKAWNLKFDKNTFRQINGTGAGASLILDLDKYNKKCEIRKIRQKLYRFNWDKLDDEKIEKLYEIIKDSI